MTTIPVLELLSTLNTRQRDTLLMILAGALVSIYALSPTPGFPLDDSWIHQVYGRNLGIRGEWAFIPGQPSTASTSPLYTVLLAAGYFLHMPYLVWTHLIGMLALGACGVLAANLGERLLNQRGIHLLTGLAVVGTWQLIWAGASGMETPVFAALTLAIILLAWRELHPRNYLLPALAHRALLRRGALFGVVGGLGILTRPEGALLVGLAGLGVLVYYRFATIPEGPGWRGGLWWSGGAGAGLLLTLAPYLLLNLSITGGLLPNTAAAKLAQHAPLLAAPYLNRLGTMTLPLLVGGQVLLLPGLFAAAVVLIRRENRAALLLKLLPLLWVAGLVALYAARLPAAYQHGRYVLPALPALVLVGVYGMILLARQARTTRIGRVLLQAWVISATLLWVIFALNLGRLSYTRDVQIINQEQLKTAHWIASDLPADARLALYDIGAVGYFAPRPDSPSPLDIAGLLTPEIIPLLNQPEALWGWLEAQGAAYLMAFPDQIPGGNRHDARLCAVYTTGGTEAIRAGGANMTVYRLRRLDDAPCVPASVQ